MICKRCQRSLRSGEGLKCGICEPCAHMRCATNLGKELRNNSDKGYRWKCSLCQSYVSNLHSSGSESSRDKNNESLMQIINALNEKVEMVNKIQLPKLNSNLANIKSVAERIADQNEYILRKIDKIDDTRKSEKAVLNASTNRYRKRSVNLTPKLVSMTGNNNDLPTSFPEKTVRYRTRRRSYLLLKIFKILNRKMSKTNKVNSPRKL
ncbi:unnamed protein product [Arctia plantaginis]|uniref:Phorbol-ester/DAG-type domain-containing protein n=1 Tax=Arctia plantaginis TaxID=874455 RepID=A0A8S0Z063_ARCPL|nr:unnamed protein product [Arctia plantaginis]